jgi:hypothetical protein
MNKKIFVIGIVLGLMLVPNLMLASAIFNFYNGTGSVDVATIQAGFGLNHGQFRKVADAVLFHYDEVRTYKAICANVQAYDFPFESKFFVESSLQNKNNQPESFIFQGFVDHIIVDNPPKIGDPCPQGQWTSVNLSIQGLFYATLGDKVVPLLQID